MNSFMFPGYLMKTTTISLEGPWSKVTRTHKTKPLFKKRIYIGRKTASRL